MSRARPAWRNPPRARKPPSGPTSITTAGSTSSSATRMAPASYSAIRATARSKIFPIPPASTGSPSPRAWSPPITTTTATSISTSPISTRQLSLPQQSRPHVHRSCRTGRRHQPQSHSFATWFFDYDNDGWPDLLVTSFFFSVDESCAAISAFRTTPKR